MQVYSFRGFGCIAASSLDRIAVQDCALIFCRRRRKNSASRTCRPEASSLVLGHQDEHSVEPFTSTTFRATRLEGLVHQDRRFLEEKYKVVANIDVWGKPSLSSAVS